MTCHNMQNLILALPDPRDVPDPLNEHLAACPGCAAWWNQTLHIERLLTELPVPSAPAGKKEVLIRELTAAAPVIRSIPALERVPAGLRLAEIFSRPFAKYTAALAASIFLLLGGWMVFRSGGPRAEVVVEAPKHPLLETVSGRIVSLSSARSQSERMELLAGLAGDLSDETRNLSRIASEDELRDLSAWYRHVVDDGLVKQARTMNPHAMSLTEKKALLDRITARLARTESESVEMARESPPHAQAELLKIAKTAHEGQAQLRTLLTREDI